MAQYGYGIKPAKTSQWVEGTKRDEFLELNRLWLDDSLGFNSESYVISQSLKFIKKLNPKLKWIISFADGMMGKNGTIYQSTNFIYTGFRKDGGVWYTKNGDRMHSVSLWHKHKTIQRNVLEEIYKCLMRLYPNDFKQDMNIISLFSGIGAFEKALKRI